MLARCFSISASSRSMISVGKAAAEIINEVRQQFKTHKNAQGFTLGQCIRLYKEKYDQFGEGNWKASQAQEVVLDRVQNCNRVAPCGCCGVLDLSGLWEAYV